MMSTVPPAAANEAGAPLLAVYLLGQVEFDACLALQQRLVYESGDQRQGPVSVLVCEHPPLITIGRQGSRGDVRLSSVELTARDLAVRWVNRGGGAVLHLPGQLAVYPIVPLERCGWRVGEFLARFQDGLLAAILEAGCSHAHRLPSRHGVWGRTGPLAAVGAAVKYGVTYFGAYVNVCPAMHLVAHVASDPVARLPLSSLLVERQQPLRMSGIRERLVRGLADALARGRYHVHTGHPLLPSSTLTRPLPTSSARAG